jgi:hypothetical protein
MLATRDSIDRLQTLFIQAKSNPVLAAAVGIKITAPKQTPPPLTPEEINRAQSTISRLDSLPIDELRGALEGMNPRDLQAAAKAVGVRTTSRTSREALVHQVVTKITNTRGYRSLRDGTNQSQYFSRISLALARAGSHSSGVAAHTGKTDATPRAE